MEVILIQFQVYVILHTQFNFSYYIFSLTKQT